MNENIIPSTHLSVDLKKNRLRIHKSCLHQMGDPQYIQLLVNPETMAVALRAVDFDIPELQAHKIRQSRMVSEDSHEIYSLPFINELCALIGELDAGYTYRMTGAVIPEQRLAVFSLKTLKRIEGQNI